MSNVLTRSGTRQVVLDTCRRTARHRVTRRVWWLAVAAVGTYLLLGPLRSLLVLSMGVAVGVVVAFAVLGLIAAALVRRTPHELPAAAPQLGHRFETTHHDVRVRAVERTRAGDVSLSLSWGARHAIELDPQGLPLGVEDLGGGSCSWTLPGDLVPGSEALVALQGLVGRDLSLVEHVAVEPLGPRVTRRVLASSTGVVLDLHS